MTPFKDILSADLLDDALQTFLKRWMYTYLAEIADQRGLVRGVYPAPRFWSTTPNIDPNAVEQVRYPAVLIVSAGATERPHRYGDGTYEAKYTIGVLTMVQGNNEDSSTRVARRYGAAVRTSVLQKFAGECDFVTGVDWIDERFTDYLGTEQAALASATEIFSIGMRGVLTAKAGPTGEPQPDPGTLDPPAPYPDHPTVGDPDDPAHPYDPINTTPGGP